MRLRFTTTTNIFVACCSLSFYYLRFLLLPLHNIDVIPLGDKMNVAAAASASDAAFFCPLTFAQTKNNAEKTKWHKEKRTESLSRRIGATTPRNGATKLFIANARQHIHVAMIVVFLATCRMKLSFVYLF